MKKLTIKNLYASADGTSILKGISTEFETGKVYAIIGPNGHGKSTLLSTIMGDPIYKITSGEILLDGNNFSNLSVDKRAQQGVYLAMQYPAEIVGISNALLIKAAMEKLSNKPVAITEVYSDMLSKASSLRIDETTFDREVNVGFSGGEKKKNELLQMLLLKPSFALLDEIDSGLDVDSINAIASSIAKEKSNDRCFIIVSHYKKLFEVVKPDVVLVIKNGKISKTGDYKLLMNLLEKGFENE